MSNNKKIYIGMAAIVFIIILFIGILTIEINGQKIAKNTYINDTNIGGLTKTQAVSKLQERYKLDSIKLSHLEKSWNIASKDISLSYDIDKTVDNAYSLNRNYSFNDNLIKTIKSYFGQKNSLKMILNYNEDELKNQIEKISKEINVDVKDANISINGSNISIDDEIIGINVNVDKSLKNIIENIQKGNLDTQLVVSEIEPKIKTDYIKDIDTILGTYTTKFNSSVKGRSSNIILAATKTSNVLLMPGDSFSYNEYTGERTVANGYKNAPVIVMGVVQEGIGGGVCQVSTTLYNAVLYSGLEIVNVKNHSIPSTYAPKGRDATVTDSGVDFVFKNNLSYPVYIKNYVSGNTVTCQIYGSSKDNQNIKISTNIDSVSVAPIKKVDDTTLLIGQEKELEKGRDGYTVSTYRVYLDKNGNTIKTEKIATSYYPKKQGIVAVGTKEEVLPPVENIPVENTPIEQTPIEEPPTQEPQDSTGEVSGEVSTEESPSNDTDQDS